MVRMPDVFRAPLLITNPWRKLSSNRNGAKKPKQTCHDLLATWQPPHNMSMGVSKIKRRQHVGI